jgi:hypothetical protein
MLNRDIAHRLLAFLAIGTIVLITSGALPRIMP